MTKKLVNFKLKETMADSQSQYVFNSRKIIYKDTGHLKLKETMVGCQSQYVFNSKTIICLFAVDYFCLFVFYCLPDIRIF